MKRFTVLLPDYLWALMHQEVSNRNTHSRDMPISASDVVRDILKYHLEKHDSVTPLSSEYNVTIPLVLDAHSTHIEGEPAAAPDHTQIIPAAVPNTNVVGMTTPPNAEDWTQRQLAKEAEARAQEQAKRVSISTPSEARKAPNPVRLKPGDPGWVNPVKQPPDLPPISRALTELEASMLSPQDQLRWRQLRGRYLSQEPGSLPTPDMIAASKARKNGK